MKCLIQLLSRVFHPGHSTGHSAVPVWTFVFTAAAFACQAEFAAEDIEYLKRTVRAEFEKKPGVEVEDVNFVKESPKKLTGFVKLKIGGLEVSKSCDATMGDDAQYIWKCE